MSGRSLPTLDRARVVQIAGDLIDEEGLDEFRLSTVAQRARVTQPALYRHVDSVADLWRALGLDTRSRLADSLAAACVGKSGADAVAAVATTWRKFGLTHPGRYRSTERFPVAGDLELEAAVERVMDVLAASLRGFQLADRDLRNAAVMLRSALHGFVMFELGDGQLAPADETFEQMLEMLTEGFAARSAAGSLTR